MGMVIVLGVLAVVGFALTVCLAMTTHDGTVAAYCQVNGYPQCGPSRVVTTAEPVRQAAAVARPVSRPIRERGCVVGDFYPSDWEDVAKEVKAAAGWKCEHCGHAHDPDGNRCLTVHHLNGVKYDCRFENLVALCQVCHLHVQARYTPGQMVTGFALMEWMRRRGLGGPPENTLAVQLGLPLPDRTDVSGVLGPEGAEKRLRKERRR